MKAFISGIVIEGVLLVFMFSGLVDGSCKPEGFALALIMLHYPVLILNSHLPQWLTILLAAAFGITVWSAVVYVLLRLLQLGRKSPR